MPFTETALHAAIARLVANFPASFQDEQAMTGILALWAELLMQHTWVDDAILRRATTRIVLEETSPYLPNVARVLDYLRSARDDLERDARAETPILPPPARREADEIDPNDPYSCTPEERERWAREDVWIRQWAARLPLVDATAPAWEVDAWQRNVSVASWPNLTPAARRAKERRIAAEKARALALGVSRIGHPGALA